MAYADPQSVTYNGVAQSMPRIETGTRKSIYQINDQTYTLTISHQQSAGAKLRSVVRLDRKVIVTNPLDSTNDYGVETVYLVLERPQFGFSMVDTERLVAALTGWLTNANVDKLYGQES